MDRKRNNKVSLVEGSFATLRTLLRPSLGHPSNKAELDSLCVQFKGEASKWTDALAEFSTAVQTIESSIVSISVFDKIFDSCC